jgi:hypothetical protein
MKTPSKLLSVMLLFVLGCLIGVSPLAAQGDCTALTKVLADAMNKVYNTPTHLYTTTKVSGETFNAEQIYAAGSIYMKNQGKWSIFGTTKEISQLGQGNTQKADVKETCRSLSDEPMYGEMAVVYSVHSDTPKGKIDVKYWISKAKGLPLRTDTDSDGGKAVISVRYEYVNVKPPM